MKNKKPFTFTLNDDLVKWFKLYAETRQVSMSSILNSFILDLKNNYKGMINKPIDTIKVKRNN